MFNKKCLNIVEKTPGNPLDPKRDEKTICEIIENYRNHPSTIKIKESLKEKTIFDFPGADFPPLKIETKLLSH